MPCCVCDREGMTYKAYMNATGWYICDDCRQRRDVSEHLPEDPPEYEEPEPTTGHEADEFAVSPV